MTNNKISPKWSVMIPTFNCAKLLEKTLQSVLEQDPGEKFMQIEVIDDCSTKDNPAEVVHRIGKGRVVFYKQEKNVGAIKNFNSCIERAKGEFVHILHGDDWVENGFYQEIDSLTIKHPMATLFAARSFIVNEQGTITHVSKILKELNNPSNSIESFYYGTPLQFSGVVVRKSFYQNNCFDENLIHSADVDMWARAIYFGKGVVSNKVLSYYRVFDGNDTSKLKKTANNLKDLIRLKNKFTINFKSFSKSQFKSHIINLSKSQILYFASLKDKESLRNNLLFLFKNGSIKDIAFFMLRYFRQII